MIVAGCSSTGGAPAPAEATGDRDRADQPPAMTVAMISHGAPGDTFWDLVRKGAEDAAANTNVELKYSSDPQAPNQVNLVQSAIDSKVDGIAMTLPNVDTLGPVAKKAMDAGIPVVGLNSGMAALEQYRLDGFFGQDESVAGEMAGKRLGDSGAKHVLCVIHEQGNSSQESRCAGVKKGMGGGDVELLYVNGQDLTSVKSTVQAKLAQDTSIDWVMSLVAPVALVAADAADAAGSEVSIATFDTNAELVQAIKDGTVAFAIDQQPYVQGYLAVEALWLHNRNGSTVGGGKPVYTGPSFVDKDNVDQIADAATKGLR
ncbi:substrate-binding domain-containing protein [Corynebacterium mendelii]|uniref:Substrate-binding domain-containing protein n=1 Tax=Corynebacterium mendelii TaxID=2765362 RepID=A0A939E043_9CORY|nr:substrate-binding domain-containing protein [Corynebacterium mendelii]MBN9643994.1 substrate-binding domain-containing protein [Corynebacterium mendelii]